MEMCYNEALVMPSNYVAMNENEMTYVDGGGTGYLTFKKSTITTAIAALAGFATKKAITAILASACVGVASAIELGTAGTGTLIAGLILYYGASAAAGAAAAIVKKVASGVYTGGDLQVKLASGSLIPSFNIRI